MHTSFLVVLPEFRRHGVAHALLEAAVSWAEEKDIDQVTAITDGNRDTNRFFARLGLVTFANVRHSGTGALRKKLSTERSRVTGGEQPAPHRGARPATVDAPAPGRRLSSHVDLRRAGVGSTR